MSNTLKAKILARNLVHRYISIYAPQIVAAVKPFIGQKIVKQDNSLTLKIKSVLPNIEHAGLRWRVDTSGQSLCLMMDVRKDIEGSMTCVYQEAYFYFAKVANGILTEVKEEIPYFKTDFTLDFVMAQNKEIERLNEEIYKIKMSIPYFS